MRSIDQGDIVRRWPSAAPFVITGAISLVAAGSTSAATAFAPSYHASWAVAYLVLVVGVAQVVLGLGQALLTPELLSTRSVISEWMSFNLGNAGVLLGTLFDRQALILLGSVLLAVAVLMMHLQVRRPARRGWPLHVYRVMLAILFVSIPIGLLLARFA